MLPPTKLSSLSIYFLASYFFTPYNPLHVSTLFLAEALVSGNYCQDARYSEALF